MSAAHRMLARAKQPASSLLGSPRCGNVAASLLGREVSSATPTSAISRHHGLFAPACLTRLCVPAMTSLPNVTAVRGYQNSNRHKRRTERNQMRNLERGLEKEYQIKHLPRVPHSAWLKKFYDKELVAFQHRLGIVFQDEGLLRSALMHHTMLNQLNDVQADQLDMETSEGIISSLELGLRDACHPRYNQQSLQLIGYAAAQHVVKLSMYQQYPTLTPYLCDSITASFVLSRATSLELANQLDIDDLVLTSAELEAAERKEFETIVDIENDKSVEGMPRGEAISDALFALVGAIKVDRGDAAAQKFLKDFLVALIEYVDLADYVPMTVDQARAQLRTILRMNEVPHIDVEARLLAQAGAESNLPVYRVGVFCNGRKLGEGTGTYLENPKLYGVDPHTGVADGHATQTDGATARAYQNTVFGILEGDTDLMTFRS